MGLARPRLVVVEGEQEATKRLSLGLLLRHLRFQPCYQHSLWMLTLPIPF